MTNEGTCNKNENAGEDTEQIIMIITGQSLNNCYMFSNKQMRYQINPTKGLCKHQTVRSYQHVKSFSHAMLHTR